MFSKEADIFFMDPNQVPCIPGTFGTLYLLRRDIIGCLGLDPDTGAKIKEPILWPCGMAVLAGIDLLAKFFKGDDKIGEVGQRFKGFIEQYFQPISTGDEEAIYQLRNALLHSFGLYSQTKTTTYRFVLSASKFPLVQQTPSGEYLIDLLTLHQRFEDAIQRYAAALNKCENLQSNFMCMFQNYGPIRIG